MILKHSIDKRGGNNLNHQQIQPEWDQLYSSPDQIPAMHNNKILNNNYELKGFIQVLLPHGLDSLI